MTPVKVKICGLTRAGDIADAVAAGADALGFVFAPRSPRCLSVEQAAELVREVPAFVARVGLFMDQPEDEVRRVLERVPLSALQFHGREGADFCRAFGRPYLKALGMGQGGAAELAAEEYEDAAALLLDSHAAGEPGGTGQTFDWSRIPRLDRPLVLAGGLNADNVRAAVRAVRPWAVDVSSGVEDAPGLKNRRLMERWTSRGISGPTAALTCRKPWSTPWRSSRRPISDGAPTRSSWPASMPTWLITWAGPRRSTSPAG